MQLLEQKTINCERLLNGRQTNQGILALSFRYYMLFRLGDESGITKAYRAVAPYYQVRPSSSSLFLAVLFYHIEMNSLEIADRMLLDFKKHAGYYKSGDPLVYGIYLYLCALLELKYDRARGVRKNRRKLDDFNQKSGIAELYMLTGDLYFRMEENDTALQYLELAYQLGCNSFYLYLLLHDLFQSGYNAGDSQLFLPFLKWVCTQNILKEYHIEENAYILGEAISENFSLIEQVNQFFSPEWLLGMICEYCARNNDYSLKAYGYYKEARKRQVEMDTLDEAIVKTAFVNHLEDLDYGTVKAYLERGSIDIDLMAYIYHLVLTKEHLKSLVEAYDLHSGIIKFAVYSLSGKVEGRYYNSIYHYALAEFCREDQDLAQEAAAVLYKNLFTYTIQGNDEIAADLYLHELERKEVGRYRLISGACSVVTPSGDFSAVLIDREKRTIIPFQPVIIKEIENEDLWLYQYFYNKGCRDDNLLIALANNYILLENPPADCSDVLQHALALSGLSQEFIINVSAAMGNLFAAKDQYDMALKYYAHVDENYLNEELIDLMLSAYVNAGDLKKAASLILKKREYISDRTLFTALKKLAKSEDYQPLIADAAYEMILNSWYDNALLDIVLRYYNAGQQEWQMLSEALNKMSIQEVRLDEIILQNSIWMRDFSKASQLVFVRMVKAAPDNKFVDDFVYYAAYEMLKNGRKPEYELLTALEKVYKKTRDRLLCYGLANTYISYNITTLVSDRILKDAMQFMEADEFILPGLKEIKDKSLLIPYIEKNQPFVYASAPDKKVVLNYRFDDSEAFIQKEMRYLKFGLFYIVIPVFHDETITYFFSEEMSRGSIATKEYKVENTKVNIRQDTNDIYYLINNALIYNKMFKYGEAEAIITGLLKQGPVIKGKII